MMKSLPPVAGVIGWPVAHSKSPLIHRFWLNKLGMDGEYARFPVHPDRLSAAIRALPDLGLSGVNVTVPHKEAVMHLVDHIAAPAEAAGAINTIVVGEDGTLAGHNTDVEGIRDALAGCELAGVSVALIGAGGAARAAMHVLREAGVADVALLARTLARAELLLDRFGMTGRAYGFEEAAAALSGRALVINASPMGMTGQPALPDPVIQSLSSTDRGALVFDMVYAPLETGLLRAARTVGLATADGLSMLIGQAGTAFLHFYGAAAPRQHDAELRALLTA